MKTTYEKDEYLARLLGYERKVIGQRTHILLEGKWVGFQTTNDLGKLKLLRLMQKRKDWDKFLTWFAAFEWIDLLLNKTGQFREVVIEFLEEQKK